MQSNEKTISNPMSEQNPFPFVRNKIQDESKHEAFALYAHIKEFNFNHGDSASLINVLDNMFYGWLESESPNNMTGFDRSNLYCSYQDIKQLLITVKDFAKFPRQ